MVTRILLALLLALSLAACGSAPQSPHARFNGTWHSDTGETIDVDFDALTMRMTVADGSREAKIRIVGQEPDAITFAEATDSDNSTAFTLRLEEHGEAVLSSVGGQAATHLKR